jgi:uncharacterized protein (TIGR03437 family)
VLALAVVAGALTPAQAQNIITTIAGSDFIFPRSTRALDAPLSGVTCTAADARGNVYLCDETSNVVARISRDGMLAVVAGNGIRSGGFSGDGGMATAARLNSPQRVAVDAAGNLYVADTANHRIRKVSLDGTISTVAGTGEAGFSGDKGPATSAQLNWPYGLTVSSSGLLYIADTSNNRVRRVDASGAIDTIAGGGSALSDGGPAASGSLYQPYDVAVDSSGNLYIADLGNSRVRKVNSQGTISTLASGIGHARGLAVDAIGTVYVANGWGYNQILKIDSSGNVSVVAGTGAWGFGGDGGPATAASFSAPPGVAVDAAGNLYVADHGNQRVRKISTLGTITTLAGSGQANLSGDGGPAGGATLKGPTALAMDSSGSLYIADSGNNRVRKISPQGIVTTVAGGGTTLGDGGPATSAMLADRVLGLALDPLGNLYIVDTDNHRIRKVDPRGTITTVAGTGSIPYSAVGDGGAATSADIAYPTAVAADAAGNVYIAEGLGSWYSSIRKVNAQGVITRIAGGRPGYAGDGGPATQALLNYPWALATDTTGNLYLADRYNSRVRKITPQGVITTVAGGGTAVGDGGPATSAALNEPLGALADALGNLYIADTGNNRIRKVSASGVISTVAGNGSTSYTADGDLATATGLNAPQGMAVDSAGNLYIADTGTDRIRVVWARAATYSVTPQKLTFTAQAGSALPVSQSLSLLSTINGVVWATTDVLTQSGGSWLSVLANTGRMPSLLPVSVNPRNLAPGTYQGTIEITAPAAATPVTTVPVSVTVAGGLAAGLSVLPASLDFRMQAGGAAPPAQALRIESASGGELIWTAGAATAVGSWLSISPPTGSTPASLQVSANPAGLGAGSYSGSVTVRSSSANVSVTVPVTLNISASTAGALLLSQTSLLFKAVQGGGAEPPQTFGVLNTGRGAIDWTAQAAESWLRLSPASGRSDYGSAQIPLVTVSVDPPRLGAGSYVGLIHVSSNNANNSPQVVKVEMQVLPAGTKLAASVRPTGLIFVAAAGGASPGAQELSVATPEAGAIQFLSQPIGGTWVTRFPDAGSASRDNAGRIMVQPALGSLSSSTYRAGLTVMTMNDGALHPVNLLLLVLPAGTSIQAAHLGATIDFGLSTLDLGLPVPAAGSTCTPSKLHVQFTSVFASFQAVVGWPTTVRVLVRDDCGNPGVGANIVLSFSNGDPPLVLTDLKNGQHQGAWSPNGYSLQVIVTAQALWQNLQGQATAAAQLGLNPNPKSVILNQGGVLLGAGFERGPVAPGSIISLFGQNLTTSAAVAQTLPLPRTLNGVRVLVGEKEAPLFYVGPSQVNAQVPFELESDRQLQVRIEVNGVSSAPEPLQTSAARPGIFTLDPPFATQGAVLMANTDTLAMAPDPRLQRSMRPAQVGEIVSIFCTGLGATDPAVASGQPGPSIEPLAWAKTLPTVTIGGLPATVSFAGLAPGFAAVYQVNAQVPAGVAAGDAVPVVITQGGFSSNTATIAVR